MNIEIYPRGTVECIVAECTGEKIKNVDPEYLLFDHQDSFSISKNAECPIDYEKFVIYYGKGTKSNNNIDYFVWIHNSFNTHQPKPNAMFKADRKNRRILVEPGFGGVTDRDSYRGGESYMSNVNLIEMMQHLESEKIPFYQITRFAHHEFIKNMEIRKGLRQVELLKNAFEEKAQVWKYDAYMIEQEITVNDVLKENYKPMTQPKKIDEKFIDTVSIDW